MSVFQTGACAITKLKLLKSPYSLLEGVTEPAGEPGGFDLELEAIL